jgi:hypothetical protein
MESPDRDETEKLGPDEGEATPEDHRGSKPPAEGRDPEPTPGEDSGPLGNPAQDEEGLSHQQQDAEPDQDSS